MPSVLSVESRVASPVSLGPDVPLVPGNSGPISSVILGANGVSGNSWCRCCAVLRTREAALMLVDVCTVDWNVSKAPRDNTPPRQRKHEHVSV